jgi:hypothetical protein
MRKQWTIVAAALLSGGATSPEPPGPPADQFFSRIAALCGRSFEGRMVTADPADTAMAGQRLVMHVADCTPDRIRIPFHVGANRSRTWVITRTATGLRLKHDHRHEDGAPDALTNYGGDTASAGTAERQEFPADAESIALFRRENRAASVTNVWAMEAGGLRFAYELRRPPGANARYFRVEFDLGRAVPAPPPAWGAAGR